MISLELVDKVRENCNSNYCPLTILLRRLKDTVPASDACPSTNDECKLRFYFSTFKHPALNERFLMQWKCLERYKFEEGKRQKRELNWQEASMSWCEEGYATAFGNVYQEGMRNGALYDSVMEERRISRELGVLNKL